MRGVQKSTFPKPSQIDAQGPVSSLRVRINRVWAQRPGVEAVFDLFRFLICFFDEEVPQGPQKGFNIRIQRPSLRKSESPGDLLPNSVLKSEIGAF